MRDGPVRTMSWSGSGPEIEPLLEREWLAANGLGGYASGTVGGAATRRYHGLLIAALPAPFGRTIVLSHIAERVRLPDGDTIELGGAEYSGGRLELHGSDYLTEFRLDSGLPIWRYEFRGLALEKTLFLTYMQNTTRILYRLVSGEGVLHLELRPSLNFRNHDEPVSTPLRTPYTVMAEEDRYEISRPGWQFPLRMSIDGADRSFVLQRRTITNIFYRLEHRRGYESAGHLWSPGCFSVALSRGRDAAFLASTERWEHIGSLSAREGLEVERQRQTLLVAAAHRDARRGTGAELVFAADDFIIRPAERIEEEARARAAGDEACTVIAGYPWFTDWGRDTMISLEGLTLATGRHAEAGYILRTFAHYVRDGLIPDLFPEGQTTGLYHTADATLWFFHAIDRYLEITQDHVTLKLLLPRLIGIIERHVEGTRFGIGVDPEDGLLRQGAEGYQLTWMDAKVGDWVVTPRRGKAVEINALWYNALRLLARWVEAELGEDAARRYRRRAERAYRSFNERFWYEDGGYLYDVIDGEDGDDDALRPNQVFAVSLPNPVLERERWERVVGVVEERLLTPVGLRSLSRDHPDYKARYDGDLRARDAAYHQGTVWAWLIGPFIEAWLKVHPGENRRARRFLDGLIEHLGEACIGSINEIFDAEPPYRPRGCTAQAWSIAEVLRTYLLTA